MTRMTMNAPKAPGSSANQHQHYQIAAIAVTMLAVCYNSLLAIINSHGLVLNFGIVAAVELMILASAAGLIAVSGVGKWDYPSLALLYVSAVLAVCVSLFSERLFIDGLRATMIVALFTMLGSRLTLSSLRYTFNICAAVVFIVLLLEMFALPTYGSLFRPLDYFAATRGYPLPEWQLEAGLALGTGNYEGRFTLGLWNGPRTSSIFLEQTGINAFSIILMIYLITMFSRISVAERCLIGIATLTIIFTNNARMATLMVAIMIAGYFVFPRLSNKLAILLCFFCLLFTFSLFQFHSEVRDDTLVGRLWVTYNYLSHTNVAEFLLGNPERRTRAMDTGYGYLVASTTMLGAAVYCFYIGLIVPDRSTRHRRLGWGIAFYLYLWLLVGGTSSSSIKTAALLWLLIGYFVREGAETSKTLPRSPLRDN